MNKKGASRRNQLSSKPLSPSSSVIKKSDNAFKIKKRLYISQVKSYLKEQKEGEPGDFVKGFNIPRGSIYRVLKELVDKGELTGRRQWVEERNAYVNFYSLPVSGRESWQAVKTRHSIGNKAAADALDNDITDGFFDEITRLRSQNENAYIAIDGPTGWGKSYLGIYSGDRLDKDETSPFDVDRVLFTKEEILNAVKENTNKVSYVIDEAGISLDAYKPRELEIVFHYMAQCRVSLVNIIFVAPSLDNLAYNYRRLVKYRVTALHKDENCVYFLVSKPISSALTNKEKFNPVGILKIDYQMYDGIKPLLSRYDEKKRSLKEGSFGAVGEEKIRLEEAKVSLKKYLIEKNLTRDFRLVEVDVFLEEQYNGKVFTKDEKHALWVEGVRVAGALREVKEKAEEEERQQKKEREKIEKDRKQREGEEKNLREKEENQKKKQKRQEEETRKKKERREKEKHQRQEEAERKKNLADETAFQAMTSFYRDRGWPDAFARFIAYQSVYERWPSVARLTSILGFLAKKVDKDLMVAYVINNFNDAQMVYCLREFKNSLGPFKNFSGNFHNNLFRLFSHNKKSCLEFTVRADENKKMFNSTDYDLKGHKPAKSKFQPEKWKKRTEEELEKTTRFLAPTESLPELAEAIGNIMKMFLAKGQAPQGGRGQVKDCSTCNGTGREKIGYDSFRICSKCGGKGH